MQAEVPGATPAAEKRSISEIKTTASNVVAFEVRGPVLPADFRITADRLEAAYQAHDHIRLLLRVRGPLAFRVELLKERLFSVKRAALRHVDRYAIVGGPDWLKPVVKFLNPLFRMEVRRFDDDDEDDAWTWLDAAPAS